jgi:hypothetical protein
MAASKIVQTVTKAVKKKPGRKSKKGRPVGSKAEKAEAKELGITVPELRKRKKAKKPKSKKKSAATKRTKKESAELRKLIRQQASDMMDTPTRSDRMRRTMVEAPRGSSVAGQKVEAGFPRSKTPPPGTTRQDRVSPARRRQLVGSGMAGVDPKTGLLTNKGTFADSQKNVAEAMNLTGRGVIPSEEDIIKRGGFQIHKKGGQVGRGAGKALRGVGCVRKK